MCKNGLESAMMGLNQVRAEGQLEEQVHQKKILLLCLDGKMIGANLVLDIQ